MTVRIEDEFYKSVKYHLIDNNLSFNEYVLKLIQQDLEKAKK